MPLDIAQTTLPVSANQQRFLLADELTPANYGLPQFFELHGPLDVDALKQTLALLIDRHSILRSVFVRGDQGYTVKITDQTDNCFQWLDLTTLSPDKHPKAVLDVACKPFDLWAGPLIRCTVAKRSQQHHLLVLNTHHSVTDGVSLAIILRELSVCYAAITQGKQPELAPQEHSYYHIAPTLWPEQPSESDRDFWTQYLQDAPSTPNVPADFKRAQQKTYAKVQAHCAIPTDKVQALRTVARQNHASVFTLFASTLSLLTSRFTGQQDVLFGYQSSGRQDRPELDQTVGLFSNVLVLRSRPVCELTFNALLTQVRDDLRQTLKHQRVPYHQLIKQTGVRPTIDLNWYPPAVELELADLKIESKTYLPWESDFDINLYCQYTPEGIGMSLMYDPTLYAPAHMQDVLDQFNHLLDQIAENADRPLRDFDLLAPPHRKTLPNPSQVTPPATREKITDLVSQQATRTPDAIAISSHAGDWTYDQLEQHSNQLAHLLLDKQCTTGDTIALLADRDASLILGMLGVLKSGCTFVVIDTGYPEGRILDYLNKVNPRGVLRCGHDELPHAIHKVFKTIPPHLQLQSNVAKSRKQLGRYPITPPQISIDPDAIAYLNYTSGSTGKPKCIQTPHDPLPHFVRWQARQFDLQSTDRFAMMAGLGHDPILRDIFTPLSMGACICVPQQQMILDPMQLATWLNEQQISVCHVTPSMGQIITTGSQDVGALPHMRHMFWGGDMLTAKDLEPFAEVCPNAQHVNFYGATETPQAMSYFRVPRETPMDVIPVGKGIDDVQILLLNSSGQLAGLGELGEIHIRTRYLSTGYAQDIEQTNARFIPNPFTGDETDRLYRTGDFGRYLHDGSVIFAGRMDDQVKIRGFRVELGDVASHVEQLPGVNKAMVQCRKDLAAAPVLVAYFTADSKHDVSASTLLNALKQTLPSYMLPSFFVKLDTWPLLPNGKINRQALPEPGLDDRPTQAQAQAPSTAREKELAHIWQSVLGLPTVSVNEDFFSLGGDSLTAIRVIYKMTRLGVDERTCRGLFQGRTIRQIASQDDPNAPKAQDEPIKAFLNGSNLANMTLVLNLLRGLLVCLLVLGHWTPGILGQLPGHPMFIRQWFTPFFNFATPGFAIIFGVSMGFIYYPMFQTDRKRTTRILRLGSTLLVGSVVVLAAVRMGQHLIEGQHVDGTVFFNTFYSVLTYYLLAILTVPLWFKFVGKWANAVVGSLVLAGLLLGGYYLAGALFLPHEQTGILQLGRLMLVAKFNYFNMSVGAVLGMAMGIHLQRHVDQSDLSKRYLTVGLISTAIGLAAGLAWGSSEQWLEASIQIQAWKWLLYGGVTCLLISGMRVLINHFAKLKAPIRSAIRFGGAIGQCALPIFLLHKIVIDLKILLDLVGVPSSVSMLAVLGLFFGITGLMMRKIYNLYYGSLDA